MYEIYLYPDPLHQTSSKSYVFSQFIFYLNDYFHVLYSKSVYKVICTRQSRNQIHDEDIAFVVVYNITTHLFDTLQCVVDLQRYNNHSKNFRNKYRTKRKLQMSVKHYREL